MGALIKLNGVSLAAAFGPTIPIKSAYEAAAAALNPRLWLDFGDMVNKDVGGAAQLIKCRASGTLFDSNLGGAITYANAVNGKRYGEFRGTHILRTADPAAFSFPSGDWGIFMVVRNIKPDTGTRVMIGPDVDLVNGVDPIALHLGFAIDGERAALFSNDKNATLTYSGTQVEYPVGSGDFESILVKQNEWHCFWIGFDQSRGVQVMRNGVTAAEGVSTMNTVYTSPMASHPIRIGDYAGNANAANRAHFDLQTLMVLDRNPFSLSIAPARKAFNLLQSAQWGVALQGEG